MCRVLTGTLRCVQSLKGDTEVCAVLKGTLGGVEF